MAAIQPPTRPIIVCGMARSGTSLTGELINSSEDIVLFPEMSVHSTSSQIDLLKEVRATLKGQPWREFTPEEIEGRVVELLRRIWGSARDPELFDDEGQPRFGLKQPHAEEWSEQFVETLGAYRPQYVYTIRDPDGIYHSTLRMSAWGDFDPDEFTDRFLASIETADGLVAAGDMFVFDLARASEDPAYRKQKGNDLFEYLDLPMNDFTHQVLDRWPAMNRSGGENKGPIPDAEIQERLQAFQNGRKFQNLLAAAERLSKLEPASLGS
ncbi:MAG: hypothetical protein V3U47_06940 [Acidimicrobiia bacterium]